MDITAVLLARVILWFPAGQELTAARVPLTDAARAIAARYAFEKYPQSADEWKAEVGAEFKYGRWNDTNIPQVTIYQRGIAIDTQTDTDDSDKILDDLLEWAPRELNVSLQRRPDERKLYVSQLVFASPMSLNSLHPVLEVIGTMLGGHLGWVSAGQQYETTEIRLHVDTSNLKLIPGPLIVARREGVPFSEHAYFSSAPVQTSQHKRILQKLESALEARKK